MAGSQSIKNNIVLLGVFYRFFCHKGTLVGGDKTYPLYIRREQIREGLVCSSLTRFPIVDAGLRSARRFPYLID
jgi:hypothetical protein